MSNLNELPSHIYSMLQKRLEQPQSLFLGSEVDKAYINLLNKEKWQRPTLGIPRSHGRKGGG
jgi:hypothetical protein